MHPQQIIMNRPTKQTQTTLNDFRTLTNQNCHCLPIGTDRKHKPKTKADIRALVVEAGMKRVIPAMMTTATTVIALLPVLTSTGKGSDIMVPMAIPLFGGMTIEILTMFVVPVLYCMWQERKLKNENIHPIEEGGGL